MSVTNPSEPGTQNATSEADTGNAPNNSPQNQNGQPENVPINSSELPVPHDSFRCINDAFMLGWKIVELKSRIQIGQSKNIDGGLQFASVWRAIFNRIAVLQVKAFPSSSTTNTLYEPPAKESLPYLYPPEPDYANVGISADNEIAQLKDFKLYEVTRRAINCLTLLYVNYNESLIPDLIRKNQVHLIAEILNAAKKTGSGGGEMPPDAVPDQTQTTEAASQQTQPVDIVAGQTQPIDPGQLDPGTTKPYTDEDLKRDLGNARAILSERISKFLEAWDGFLRENYYIGGQLPYNDTELIAFEAGRSMSWLSWGISVKTVSIDIAAQNEPNTDFTGQYELAWKEIFQNRAIIHLQHQITALSATLDNVYAEKRKTEQKLQDGKPDVDDINLPSNAIQAVKNSIDYWARTVNWVFQPENKQKERESSSGHSNLMRPMKLALIEQADIWQTLMTGQQSLNAFNMENVTHKIMGDVTKKMELSLQSNFREGLDQAKQSLKEISGEIKDAVVETGKVALSGLNDIFKSSKLILIIGGVFVALLLAFFIIIISNPANAGAAGKSGGITGLVSLVLGFFGLNKLKKDKDNNAASVSATQVAATTKIDRQADKGEAVSNGEKQSGFMNQLQTAADDTRKMIWTAFERGYQQIRKELAYMNRSAAVSYPLIEFFTLNFTIDADGDFLTQIIWSSKERSEEVERVVSAALGPLAAFIYKPTSNNEAN